jgi:hypothetical protein
VRWLRDPRLVWRKRFIGVSKFALRTPERAQQGHWVTWAVRNGEPVVIWASSDALKLRGKCGLVWKPLLVGETTRRQRRQVRRWLYEQSDP